MSPLFVSFAIFRTVSKVKKIGCFAKKLTYRLALFPQFRIVLVKIDVRYKKFKSKIKLVISHEDGKNMSPQKITN